MRNSRLALTSRELRDEGILFRDRTDTRAESHKDEVVQFHSRKAKRMLIKTIPTISSAAGQ